MTMSEETNRLCTDAFADLLITTDRLVGDNLRREGIPADRIHSVGNVMIDTPEHHRRGPAKLSLLSDLGLEPRRFAVLTLHRPSNVDDRRMLAGIFHALKEISRELLIVFPVDPRTRARMEEFVLEGLLAVHAGQPAGLVMTGLAALGRRMNNDGSETTRFAVIHTSRIANTRLITAYCKYYPLL